jgi:hypothetical protein
LRHRRTGTRRDPCLLVCYRHSTKRTVTNATRCRRGAFGAVSQLNEEQMVSFLNAVTHHSATAAALVLEGDTGEGGRELDSSSPMRRHRWKQPRLDVAAGPRRAEPQLPARQAHRAAAGNPGSSCRGASPRIERLSRTARRAPVRSPRRQGHDRFGGHGRLSRRGAGEGILRVAQRRPD